MPHVIQSKSILNKAKRRDPWFLDDYTINPYSGCSFNCYYCYIRGSKYGENMEEKTAIKTNAAELLEKQLSQRAKKGQYGIIVLSSATDPYLHFEKDTKLTRSLLEIILKYRFPVHIITKSDLVQRDFDLLEQIDKTAILPADLSERLTHGAFITFSFSTLDNMVAKLFEPGAPLPDRRLQALDNSLRSGFTSGVSLMPLLPFISDTGDNLEHMFLTFKNLNVSYLFPATITLFGSGPSDSKTLILKIVEKHYPHLLTKYQAFFANSTQIPEYYARAFYEKTRELSLKYGLKNSLI